MSSRTITCLTIAFVGFALASIFACEIRVRDSAFRVTRDIHKLCVIAEYSDASADDLYLRLQQWLEETERTFNLEIVRINADDPETNWQSIGLPSSPPTLPVTVLVGRNNGVGEGFVIDHWETAPTRDELSAIIDSPVRQQLALELARNIAVLVFAPGDSLVESPLSRRLKSVVEAGIAGERIGISMMTLDRNDPSERLLCRFMGLRPGGDDTLCVAFGRGKLMVPPLVGEDITVENIDGLVTQIRQACSCSKPLQTMGVDIPLVWSDAIDSNVVLMDQELELSELDREVQNMLAAKATNAVVSQPVVIPIAAGRQSALSPVDTAEAPKRSTFIKLGLVMLGGIVLAFALSRRRFSRFNFPK